MQQDEEQALGQNTVPVWPRANQRLSAVRLCGGSATQVSESRLTGMSDTSCCHGPSSSLTGMLLGPRAKVVMGPDRTRQACAQHTVEAFRGRHRAEEATTQAFLVLHSPWTRFHQHWREKRGPQRLVADKGMWGWLHFPETVRKKSADRKHGRHHRHGDWKLNQLVSHFKRR